MNSMSNDLSNPPERDDEPARPSRAAEYITALYVALVLLTPWLLRDAPLFSPSKGFEIQMSKQALPKHAAELKAQAAPQGPPANVPVRAN